MVYEAPELVPLGCPIILKDIFSLDPLTVDMQAIDCRAVLDALERSGSDFDAAMIWESLLPHYPLRLIKAIWMICGSLNRFYAEVTKQKWNFGGKIAVVAHIIMSSACMNFSSW